MTWPAPIKVSMTPAGPVVDTDNWLPAHPKAIEEYMRWCHILINHRDFGGDDFRPVALAAEHAIEKIRAIDIQHERLVLMGRAKLPGHIARLLGLQKATQPPTKD